MRRIKAISGRLVAVQLEQPLSKKLQTTMATNAEVGEL
ncbi:hypothetical protein M917_0928 [Psychrobacter aquaticus CMS 56]|uniref:Uncharacterized protein n=1 Tax=Psychrobacter aquaticus CMS 56 TaxID=1354303 RepID=U4T5R2_9GAMM|nr:hypothetical protein M917_0928 [Psychrobacter aquaticus CMS 56]